MKKFRVIQAILVLFSAIAVTSCGDEPTLDPLNGGFSDTNLSVAFDNRMFVTDNVTANVAGGAVTFTATGEAGEVLTMTVNETQFRLSDPTPPQRITGYENVSMTYIDGTGGDEYVNVSDDGSTSGTITITALDIANRTISGNFSFMGYNPDDPDAAPVAFYTGVFSNVPYTGANLPAALPVMGSTPPAQDFMKAKIDGVMVDFGMLSAMPASGDIVLSGGTVTPLTSLSLTVEEGIVPGDYPFATSPVDGAYGVYNAGSTPHVSEDGTLTITSNTGGVIKGKFAFSAVTGEGATVEVTEGEFSFDLN